MRLHGVPRAFSARHLDPLSVTKVGQRLIRFGLVVHVSAKRQRVPRSVVRRDPQRARRPQTLRTQAAAGADSEDVRGVVAFANAVLECRKVKYVVLWALAWWQHGAWFENK